MSAPSKYATNQFLIATEDRHPLMTAILADVLPKIEAAAVENSAFDNLRDSLQGLHTQWQTADTVTANGEALSLSCTRAFETKMESLRRKPDPDSNSPLTAWCLIIEPVAPVGSPLYTLLLPQGRETLTTGSWEVQLNSVKNLGIRLAAQTTKPTLVALASTVTGFHTAAKGLRDAQTEAAQALVNARADQEAVRTLCAVALHAMCGFAMQTWSTTPDRVDELFDVTLLRDPDMDIPIAVADTTWTPGTRALSTTELPEDATMLEAWRLGPGGAPERVGVGTKNANAVVIPAAITFDPGKTYQLWLVAKNSRGSSPAGPIQTWLAT